MTDHFFSADQAESLLDGVPGDVPDHLRGVADLLAAAHQPATAGELSGMSATVQQFAAAATTPIETTRSITMFGTRLTRRAAAAIIATVLTGGTAAAAAGALPTPFTNNGGKVEIPVVEPTIAVAPATIKATEVVVVESTTSTTSTTEVPDATEATDAPDTNDATETENTDSAADEQDQVDQNDDANENDEQDEVDQNDDGDQNNQQDQVGQNDDGEQEQDD